MVGFFKNTQSEFNVWNQLHLSEGFLLIPLKYRFTYGNRGGISKQWRTLHFFN